MAEETDLEKCKVKVTELPKLWNSEAPWPWLNDLGSGRGHTGAHIWLRCTHTPN